MKINQTVGASGEFKAIVRRADGSVRHETEWQPNLITDNGLKLLSNNAKTTNKNTSDINSDLMSACCIGSGNATPAVTDVALTNFVAFNTRQDNQGHIIENPTAARPNHVKTSVTRKFVFTGLNNENITELGLANSYSGSSNYSLYTHALIKDNSGTPTTLTVLSGEILEIFYTFNMYYDVRSTKGELTLTKMAGGKPTGTETFIYVIKPFAFSSQDTEYPLNQQNPALKAYGVKEADSELSASYSLTAWETPATPIKESATETQVNELIAAHTLGYNSGWNSYYPHSDNPASWRMEAERPLLEVLEQAANSQKLRLTIAPAGAVFPNGIRAIVFSNGHSTTTKFKTAVAFANKANGQGIKKKDTERLSFEITTRHYRYEGTP